MKKLIKIIIAIIILIITIFLIIYPNIEFYKDGYLYMMFYDNIWEESEIFKELDQETCYDESYTYNKERDISISSFNPKKFLFFKWFKIKYEEGNVCTTEYTLEESYIKHFLENAKINEESDKVDLAKIIKGKEAIVSNKKYSWNDDYKYISYKLDGKENEMYIYTNEEGLLIIQVGSRDEDDKYIAYK